jgi:hypothetical protein
MSSALDHVYTPRSCLLPGTVLSSRNATNSVTTIFMDIRALIAKSSWQVLDKENDSLAHLNIIQLYLIIHQHRLNKFLSSTTMRCQDSKIWFDMTYLFKAWMEWSTWCCRIRNQITWQYKTWLRLVLLKIRWNGHSKKQCNADDCHVPEAGWLTIL